MTDSYDDLDIFILWETFFFSAIAKQHEFNVESDSDRDELD